MISMVAALAATLAALAGVVWSGITRRRALHYRLIVVLVVCLALAIWRAEAYGRTLIFLGTAATLHRVHMVAVVLTFLMVPLVVSSGIKLARARGAAGTERLGHRRQAVRFVILILIASALGTAMTLLADRA